VTTIAPQALTLLNDALAHRAAADLARGLAGDERERIDLAYLRALGRFPTAGETAMVRDFLAAGGDWEDLALSLLNANEFVYLD
jgi:hypothetical protein